jgi:hypothetical protein
MKKELFFIWLIILINNYGCGQQNINKLIKDNLLSRYVNVEILSITQDSCPDMRNLFDFSVSLRINAAECKLNISKAFMQYSKN